jgi:hypothetical protein
MPLQWRKNVLQFLLDVFPSQEHVLLMLEEIYDHHTHLIPLHLPLPLLRCLDKESTAHLFKQKDFFPNRVELPTGRNLGRKS